MIAFSESDLIVRDSIFDPYSNEQFLYMKERTEKPLYKVHLFIEGNSVPYIEKVTYILHESFTKNKHTVERTMQNPYCRLTIWTWGIFTVKVKFHTKDGNTFSGTHYLTYAEEVQNATYKVKRI